MMDGAPMMTSRPRQVRAESWEQHSRPSRDARHRGKLTEMLSARTGLDIVSCEDATIDEWEGAGASCTMRDGGNMVGIQVTVSDGEAYLYGEDGKLLEVRK